MKKFTFPLARVLRFHQQRLKQVELRLAKLAAERDAALSEVKRLMSAIDRECQLNEFVGGTINLGARLNSVRHLEQLGRVLTPAQERLKQAEGRFREVDHERIAIQKQVEGFSQLRDQQRLQHHDEATRLQQIDLDEVVMRMWSVCSDMFPSNDEFPNCETVAGRMG